MLNNDHEFDRLNSLVIKLNNESNKRKMLDIGLQIADEVMTIFGIPANDLDKGEDELDKALPNTKFKNQKMEGWFEKHPYLGSARTALWHYNTNKYPIESMFYMLSDSPRKEKIAATTHLFPHWEDNDLTMIPKYKVGIDFFLSPKTKSVFIVISKRTNLRVMELSERLTNTQKEIFAKCHNIATYDGIDPKTNTKIQFEPQRTIHNTLWNAFELKEVNKKFYIGIADHFQLLCQHLRRFPPVGTENDIIESSKIFASRLIGRLLFIWFLKKKGIINPKMNYFNPNDVSAQDYYEKKLKVLFFNTLNTPIEKRNKDSDLKTPYLNGGLFEPHQNDWPDKNISFPKNWFVSLYQHLNLFNFTTDESSSDYEQVAVDPEMLGRVFENLLASIVPETSKISERSEKGAFYTPREVVDFMCKSALKEYLKRHTESDKDYDGIDRLIDMSDSDFMLQKSTGLSELWGIRTQKINSMLIKALNEMTILDPACGSGAFPIGMLQLILKTYERLNAFYDQNLDSMRPIKPFEHNNLYETKLFIIRHCLYGSDIEPMAVEIARLRAWLSLIIDDKKEVDPLPNLDFNFVCANSLVPLQETHIFSLFFDINKFDEDFNLLKEKYFSAHDYETKQKLREDFKKLYDETDEELTGGKEIVRRVKQLKSWNPFNPSKAAEFFDSKKMLNVENFDIVIGNPPYINFNDIKELSHKIYEPLKYETYKATGDMYCLFIEKGVKSLKENGILCFITSNKWMRAGYGESLRGFLAKNTNPLLLIDFGGLKVFDSATVDTDILIVSNSKNLKSTICCKIKQECLENLSVYIKQNMVKMNFSDSKNWVIIKQIEKSIKDKIEACGKKLSLWNISINRGILTGYNDAFIINEKIKNELISEDPKSAEIIRPILRGRNINRFGYKDSKEFLIVSHNGDKNRNIPKIDIDNYKAIKKFMDGFGDRLFKRTDQGDTPYNLRNCTYMDDFSKRKIIYPETTQNARFYIDDNGFYADKTCFILTGPYLEYLAITFSSSLFEFAYRRLFSTIELGKNGYQYNKQAMILVPIKEINQNQNESAINLYHNLLNNNYDQQKIDDFIFRLYKLNDEEKEYIINFLNKN